MSFLKKMFGLGTKSQETDNKTGDTFYYRRCKAVAVPYIDITEDKLRMEKPELLEENYLSMSKLYELFLEEVSQLKISDFDDIYRPNQANKKGGIDFHNDEVTSMIRGAGTDIIKQVGKKILSGDFNLTTISFPIKVMIPYTMLQACGRSAFQLPYYMHLCQGKDMVERLKLTIVATISSFCFSGYFLKPMNPVLGETYECLFTDGSKYFAEQTSHHPPVSSYEVYGPNKSYYFAGYSKFGSSAGLNSVTVSNKGRRFVQFPDGVKFEFDFFKVSIILIIKETFSNSFWGILKHETHGEVVYIEKKHNISCKVKMGMTKGQPSDYIYGEIFVGNEVVSILKGSYMSHMDFDGKRYWDIRENFPIKIIDLNDTLPSSSIFREDRILLEEGKLDEAQIVKEKIENIQRADRKLREKYKK